VEEARCAPRPVSHFPPLPPSAPPSTERRTGSWISSSHQAAFTPLHRRPRCTSGWASSLLRCASSCADSRLLPRRGADWNGDRDEDEGGAGVGDAARHMLGSSTLDSPRFLHVFTKELVGSRSRCLTRSFLRSPRRTRAFFPDAGHRHMKLDMGWVSS
jgi:hypothetical protein